MFTPLDAGKAKGMYVSAYARYIDNPDEARKLYKRSLVVLALSQLIAGAGFIAGLSAGALLANQMLGINSLSGLPFVAFSLGSAVAAVLIGRISQRVGRRTGLAAGFITGGIGAAGIVLATIITNTALFFAALFVYGAGSATSMQARYAGTDLARAKERATSVGMVLVALTFGVLLAPLLTDWLQEAAISLGALPNSGVFILAGSAYLMSGLFILIFLRPDPLLVSLQIQRAGNGRLQNKNAKLPTDGLQQANDGDEREQQVKAGNSATGSNTTYRKGMVFGIVIMTAVFMVMVLIMTMTPVHMQGHGHGLMAITWIIGIHIAAMYLPSLFSGMFVDRIGKSRAAMLSGLVLAASAVLTMCAPAGQMALMAVALSLLGIGWNIGFISGTTMVVDSVAQSERAKIQGIADVFIAFVGAAGGFFAGVIEAQIGFYAVCIMGLFIALATTGYAFIAGKKA